MANSTQPTNSRSRRNRILFFFVAAAIVCHIASSFHILPSPTIRLLWNSQQPKPEPCSNRISKRLFRQQDQRHDTRHWDSSAEDKEKQQAYDSLYEFLTKRTGETAGHAERERKRDRIRKWVTSSSSNASPKRSSIMVQPLRVEDGSVMEDPTNPNKKKKEGGLDQILTQMPTLDDILSESDTSKKTEAATAATKDDDFWFEEEKLAIQAKYNQTLVDIRTQIAQQRAEDPDAIPANAEAIAESVVVQEMQRMVSSVRTARSKERLQALEIQKMAELESSSSSPGNDELAKRLLQEAADDWKRRDTLQANLDNFELYQKEVNRNFESNTDSLLPQPGSDLDAWALERLEKMLDSSQNGDQNLSIRDILEENIEDLQKRLKKQAQTKGSVEPQTMKEWQMYRAIAARLNRQPQTTMSDPALNQKESNEEMITKQLNSWREYIGKEKNIRERSGLSAGPKMPFDWQRASKDAPVIQTGSPKTRREIRRDLNIQAIQAMEDLVVKSDKSRAVNLKKQLEWLKAELEPRDYNDVENEATPTAEEKAGPIDLKGFFRSKEEPKIGAEFNEFEKYKIDRMMSGDPIQFEKSLEVPQSPPSPPKTPFFSDNSAGEDTESRKVEPPKTPFFLDDIESENTPSENSKLGSGEEQKLRAMFQRAGAKSKEEQDAIREQWEAFKKFEQSRRQESGLSDSSDSSLIENANVKYDISDVLTGDGDFDAKKVLASIGPRPVRKKPSMTTSTMNKGSDSSTKLESDVEPTEVSDALYRSVAAVGGGRSKDDPSLRSKEKADFEEYMEKEEAMRRGLNTIDEDAAKVAATKEVDLDGDKYAKDALESIGPRPVFKRKKKETLDDGVESESIVSDGDDDLSHSEPSSKEDLIPDWLKQERKAIEESDTYADKKSSYFSGKDIDDMFDDDKYEHNLRQLAEYERRRSGKKPQMGIDITDALGRRGTDDYADYTYDTDYFRGQQGAWGSGSFEARKANLLEYVELNTVELNNLIDHRDSVYSTGVSEYLPRINKPFSEFGAIFRLEGVIVDLTGLHELVWTQVAKEFQFKEPMLEDIQRAAVARPDTAVREIFYWTNDIVLVRKVTDKFRKVFRDTFDQWAKEKGISGEPSSTPPIEENAKNEMALGALEVNEESRGSSMGIGEVEAAVSPMNEQTKMLRLKELWTATANKFGYSQPSNEQIAQCSFLPPYIAIRDVFRWSSDTREVDTIASHFTQLFNGVEPASQQTNVAGREKIIDEGAILELQSLVWATIAREASFPAPTPEEVLAASVLNDPEAVVQFGFGWTDDDLQIKDLANRYRQYFSKFVNERLHNRTIEIDTSAKETNEKEVDEEPVAVGPSDEEILEAQVKAWSEVARIHKLRPPSPDQIQLTMNMAASDSARRLLGWTYNFNNDQINEISETYEKILRTVSAEYFEAHNVEVGSLIPKPEPLSNVSRDGLSNNVSGDELFQAAYDSWAKVADRLSYPAPDEEQVLFAMTVGPEEAVITGFQWADNYAEAKKISADYLEEIKLKRAAWHRDGFVTSGSTAGSGSDSHEERPLVQIMPGVDKWIRSLYEVEMGCGVTSHLEDDQLAVLLKYAGLADLLPPEQRVASNQGYDRDSQQMLGVALRIERRPDHCVVFDSSPYASAAAHEVDMRSVSFVGAYPRYELLSADTSASSFDDLTAMNIRRLFGERVYDQPMLAAKEELQAAKKTKTLTRFWDPED